MQSSLFAHQCMLVPSLSKELLHTSILLPLSSAVCLCCVCVMPQEKSNQYRGMHYRTSPQAIVIYFIIFPRNLNLCMFFNNVASSVLCKCGGNPERQQLDHSVHRWPDVLLEPGYALPTTGKYCFRAILLRFHQLNPLSSWI